MSLVDANTGEVVDDRIRLDDLINGPQIRASGLNRDHVAQLAESLDHLPPVLVRRTAHGFEILDGHHRAAAYDRAGVESVLAHVITCTDGEALAFALEANIGHGLPLSLADKKRNALVLIEVNPGMADREVGRICGLSNHTVAALRPGGRNAHLDERAGADGKAYPTPEKAKAQRAVAEKFVAEKPDATVDEIAEQTGVSRGTAGNIKKERAEAAERDPEVEQAIADALDSDQAIQLRRYKATVVKEIEAAHRLVLNDTERVAACAEVDAQVVDLWDSLDRLREGLTNWFDALDNHRPSGLRVVNGGKP